MFRLAPLMFILATSLLGGCIESSAPLKQKAAAIEACGIAQGDAPARTAMTDVGGFKLFAEIRGVAVPGMPTIVFDAGGGEDHSPWLAADVQQTLARTGLTVSYDRAGMGQSEDGGLPKTALEQAKQLHALLRNAELPAPYLLVSHSITGFNARVFADLYPEDTYGVVFVDSSHEGMNEGLWLPITIVDVSSSGEMNYPEFTESVAQAQDSRTRDGLRNKPISVLSATCHGSCIAGISIVNEAGWAEFQADLASLSDNSVHVTAPAGSEHHLMTTQPQMVIDGICEILGR